ncbi:MAG TPA: AI-2E family transporter [Thermodesulfatator atlanticus]|uniref:AI-2E family transporter n=1 Tax=Thermodesulfatator atlanticus TaxID=501497 RepID=A0A7V5P0X0_9BACT|nr:AI-2E family transporter [Thermodesulfatator atlanticus]
MQRNLVPTVIGFLLAGSVLFLTLRLYLPFFQPIAWAAVIALFLHPVNRLMRRLLGGRRGLAALLLCILFVGLVFVPLIFALTNLTSQAIEIITQLKKQLETKSLAEIFIPDPHKYPYLHTIGKIFFEKLALYEKEIQSALLSLASSAGQFILSQGTVIFRNTVNLILQVIFMLFTLFYLFRDGDYFVEGLKGLLPVPPEEARRIVEKVQQVIEATLYGSILTALAQGGLALIIYLILEVPSSLLLGLLTALASFIPLVGTGLVWLPLVIYFLLSASYVKALILLAYGSLFISQIDSLIRPYFIGGRTEIHNLFIFFSILGGLKLFGFLGVFLGPILVALSISVIEIYHLKLAEESYARTPGSGDY